MKARLDDSSFKPVTLVLESQAEVDAIYAILNHISISKAIGLGDLNPSEILGTFPNEDNCNELHRILDRLIK